MDSTLFLRGIIIIVLGLAVALVPAIIWYRSAKSYYADDKIVKKRRRYRDFSVFGFIICISGMFICLDAFEGDRSFVSLLAMAYLFGTLWTFFEPYYGKELADRIDDLCLYLRPFQQDGGEAGIRKNRKGFIQGDLWAPTPIEKELCQELSDKIAHTYGIGNPGHCLPTMQSTTSIYSSDKDWKQLIERLADKASVIAIYVANTEGCVWEINHCIQSKMIEKTLFFVENEDALNILKLHVGDHLDVQPIYVRGRNSFYCIYYDCIHSKWIAESARTKDEIKKSINGFIASHPQINRQVENQKNRSRIKNCLFNSKDAPRGLSHYFSFAWNPIAYWRFNHWTQKWRIIAGVYLTLAIILACIIVGIYFTDLDVAEQIILTILFWYAILLPLILLAPRISWCCHRWGSKYLFTYDNRALSRWLLITFLTISIFSCIAAI